MFIDWFRRYLFSSFVDVWFYLSETRSQRMSFVCQSLPSYWPPNLLDRYSDSLAILFPPSGPPARQTASLVGHHWSIDAFDIGLCVGDGCMLCNTTVSTCMVVCMGVSTRDWNRNNQNILDECIFKWCSIYLSLFLIFVAYITLPQHCNNLSVRSSGWYYFFP